MAVEIEEPTWNSIAIPSKYDNKLIYTLKLIVHAVLDIGKKTRFSTVTHTPLLYLNRLNKFFTVFSIK